MIKYYLFDLDGTLTDPFEGITNSVVHALKKYNIEVEDKKALGCFIGPPLYQSFMKYYGFSREEAERAVGYYREHFSVKGLFENELYDGVHHLLATLRERGKTIILATSKPAVYAQQIIEHFNIAEYFDFLSGSELDGRRINKNEVIEYALGSLGIDDRDSCIMIGDRQHDIMGAKKTGIRSAGVLWGYGSREELECSGADRICERMEEILDIE